MGNKIFIENSFRVYCKQFLNGQLLRDGDDALNSAKRIVVVKSIKGSRLKILKNSILKYFCYVRRMQIKAIQNPETAPLYFQ